MYLQNAITYQHLLILRKIEDVIWYPSYGLTILPLLSVVSSLINLSNDNGKLVQFHSFADLFITTRFTRFGTESEWCNVMQFLLYSLNALVNNIMLTCTKYRDTDLWGLWYIFQALYKPYTYTKVLKASRVNSLWSHRGVSAFSSDTTTNLSSTKVLELS